MKKHKVSGIESNSYKSMYWDSNEGIDGMHVLSTIPDANGNMTDTYMQAEIDKLVAQDKLVGSAVVGIINAEAA